MIHRQTEMSHTMRKCVFGSLWQERHKLTCSATETSWNLEISDIETRGIILSWQWTTKVLIRLRGCAGWSASLLFAYGIRHIFSWPGSNVYIQASNKDRRLPEFQKHRDKKVGKKKKKWWDSIKIEKFWSRKIVKAWFTWRFSKAINYFDTWFTLAF